MTFGTTFVSKLGYLNTRHSLHRFNQLALF